MNFIKTSIPDVVLIEPKVFGDHRGFFLESWRQDTFREQVADVEFVQDNHSKSNQGILRGMHYQTEQTQGKLVRVTSGTVFDVAVDMRRSSPTFGEWVGYELSAKNKHMLWVPAGFAHGFYVMSESAEFVYKCTNYYAPQFEHSLLWNDPELSIEWPLINGALPMLSEKDKQGVLFADTECFD